MTIPLSFLLKAVTALLALGFMLTVAPLVIAAVLPRGNLVADRLRVFASCVPTVLLFCIARFEILLAIVIVIAGVTIAILHA
ncbi:MULTISPECIES: hypothetical protein [unclassified Variovorax]|jgi:hypothetical protein|uniref:hypothetical protein n=1 Tax=unclassified Variovorax TaxID=663243 RepID=UPI000F7E7008|nr:MULTISPECIES: hypothetical protein [unclassified Variovorax]RSZ47160.1 hypothetical protein EJO70_00615 [Variovorax sp. 553]RSZ48718.1 hypothetical protein EJO71_03355 [Variovorax sp. 679]